MIGLALALLAAPSAGPEPRRRDVVMIGPPRDLDLPERAFDSRRQDLIVIEEADRVDPIDFWRNDPHLAEVYRGVEHEHQGKYLHQYARQPRASAHRICRGRP